MVAKITIPKSIEAALNYNEKKVQKGAAECLCAANYLSEAKNMNFYQKQNYILYQCQHLHGHILVMLGNPFG